MKIFDLTKEIHLDKDSQKKYTLLRSMLHVVFVFLMFFVAYFILFPTIPLDFDMNNPNANKNSLVTPRLAQTNIFPEKGIIPAKTNFIFDANPIGNFSNIEISFTTSKKMGNLENATVQLQKSYRAFFYPTGKEIGFKNGTLLYTTDGSYYMISNEKLRKFANPNVILQLGFPKSGFTEVSTESLKFNERGEEISDPNNYPDDSIFIIDENFYQLKNQQLVQFVSTNAFLSQFDPKVVISKDAEFLNKYPLSQSYLGFIDGTLASNADSVYILSEGKSYPIFSAVTFVSMGFDWNNIVPISSDELGMYDKQKLYTNDSPRPNGIIFFDQKYDRYYIIKNEEKLPISNVDILKTYPTKNAVVASSDDAAKKATCNLQKNLFSSNIFSCQISLKEFNPLIGNDYQITLETTNGTNLSWINTTFSTPISVDSLKNSLSVIKNKIQNR